MSENNITAEYIKHQFSDYTRTNFRPSQSVTVEQMHDWPHDVVMSELTREEISARIEASEARVATVVESLRADASDLRADLRDGMARISSQGEVAQAKADQFYAEAHKLLAESRTALTEIRLAGEQSKVNVMGLGYKFLTWFFGAIVALGGLGATVYTAVKRAQESGAATQNVVEDPRPTVSGRSGR